MYFLCLEQMLYMKVNIFGTSIARPLIAKKQIQIAKKVGAIMYLMVQLARETIK